MADTTRNAYSERDNCHPCPICGTHCLHECECDRNVQSLAFSRLDAGPVTYTDTNGVAFALIPDAEPYTAAFTITDAATDPATNA